MLYGSEIGAIAGIIALQHTWCTPQRILTNFGLQTPGKNVYTLPNGKPVGFNKVPSAYDTQQFAQMYGGSNPGSTRDSIRAPASPHRNTFFKIFGGCMGLRD